MSDTRTQPEGYRARARGVPHRSGLSGLARGPRGQRPARGECQVILYGAKLTSEVYEVCRDPDWARGEAEGKAEAEWILTLLRKRGVAVAEAAAAQILSCRDIGVLDRWFDRAIPAAAVQDLFGQ